MSGIFFALIMAQLFSFTLLACELLYFHITSLKVNKARNQFSGIFQQAPDYVQVHVNVPRDYRTLMILKDLDLFNSDDLLRISAE